MLSSSVVFHFTFLCIVHHSQGIEPLSRYIAPIDILNEVVNQIFSSLQIKTHRESKIKEYSKMHKYFVSLARLHKNDWIELLKITSLDITIDHGTGDYTTIINEVLNEGNKTEAVNDILNEENVNKHIENFLGTLENVKELYLRNNSYITVNYEILQRFHRDRHSLRNKTMDRLHAQNDSDFWEPDGRRIYQGKKTKIKNFPFMASIHMFDQFTCAGSIIHADLVITAASCLQLAHNNRFYRENPSYLSVRIGSSTYVGGDHVPVLEVYFYPSYDPKTLRNNLAILRLQRVIKFNKKNKNVKKIRVDTNAWALPSNTDGITIIGWGARKKSNKIYNPLKNKLSMDVLHFYGLADCRDVYSKVLVTKKNFCAGFISRGGGACNRDVGAPGVVNGILAGVVSFGSPNCGKRDSPTVFTKLGYYIDWIEDIMAQDPPKQSVRITTRRPHIFNTIMSTPPLHDSNFVIEPIDLSKVPDIRDLDVRMPHDDNNEFINGEFNSIQSVSRQTFPANKQIMKKKPKDPKKFLDITRLRDENENKGSPETTYEPPQLNPIYTVMGSFDEDEVFPGNNDKAETSTTADLLDRTRAQNKELKDDKPNWQTGLQFAEESESGEDSSEIPDGTEESITTHKFESTTTPLNVIDKFEANHTDAEKLLSSDDYDEDNDTVVVQQSLPVQLTSKEKVIPIKTPEKAIVNEDKREVSHKVKKPVKSTKDKKFDSEIDDFIENLDFEGILISEEESQVLTDTEFPEQRKNQKVTVNHKRFSLRDQKTKTALRNEKLRDLAQKDDNVFPLQDQKTKPAPKKYFLNQQDQMKKALPQKYYKFPIQDKNTEPPSTNYYTVSLQDEKTEPVPANDYLYPQQDQEAELSPKNDHMSPLQDQKTKPAPKKYYTVSLQNEKTEPAGDYMYPQQDQEVEPLPKNDHLFPQQDQNTKSAPIKYYTVSLQDEKTEPARTNYYMYPQQDQEVEPSPKNDHMFPLKSKKTKPPPKTYYLNPQQDQDVETSPKNDHIFPLQSKKTKLPPNKYYTVSLQNEKTETAPANDYMYPQQDQEVEPSPKNDHMFPLQSKKTKLPPNKYYTVSLQNEKTETAPANDYMYPQQDQEVEPSPKNDHMFPLPGKKRKPPPKTYYLNPQQDQNTNPALEIYNTVPLQDDETKSALKNDYIFSLQDRKTKPPPKEYYTVPIQSEETKLAQKKYDSFPLRDPAPNNDDIFSLQDQKIQPAPTNSYIYSQKYQKTKPTPNSYYTFPLQDEETESAPTNYYMYPQQAQEVEPAPMNDHTFPLQDQKTEPPPKKYYLNQQQDQKIKTHPKNDYMFPLQDEETEPARINDYMNEQQHQANELAPSDDHKFLLGLKAKQPPKTKHLNPQQDQKKKSQPKNDYMFPLQDEKTEPAPINDYMNAQQHQANELAPLDDHKFLLGQAKQPPKTKHLNPQQDQKKKSQAKNYYTFPLQDEKTEPAPINDYMNAQQHQAIELAPSYDHKFLLGQAKQPPQTKHLNPQQDQKKKSQAKNYYTFPLQDEKTEPAPINDYMNAQQHQAIELATSYDHKFLLGQAKQPPKTKHLNPQQDQKKKSQAKNYYTFPLQDEKTEPAPINDYMNAQQHQAIELAPSNDHKFLLGQAKQPPKTKHLNPQQDQKKKSQPKNYYTFPLQDEETKPAPINDYMNAQQHQANELAPSDDHKFLLYQAKQPPKTKHLNSQQDQKKKSQPKKYYTIPQYAEIKPGQRNDDGFLPQPQKGNPARTYNFVLPLQDQKAKPAQKNPYVPPLEKKPKPGLKGEDMLTFLYLADNEKKPDDSSAEALSIERKKFKNLTMDLVFDVIAEELLKNNSE